MEHARIRSRGLGRNALERFVYSNSVDSKAGASAPSEVNLKTTCDTVDKDAALRKKNRLEEIQAINELSLIHI